MNESLPVIAVAQLPMFWSRAENVEAMLAAIDLAADAGAQIVVFSELAITGFHRQIAREADSATMPAYVRLVGDAARRRGASVVFGAPTFESGEERPFNSHLHVGPDGMVAAIVSKQGLTTSEATFFAPGRKRPTAWLAGVACSSVLCREVEDIDQVVADFGEVVPDIVFWPSFIGGPARAQGDVAYLPLACEMARRLRCYVVQANWPVSLNIPDSSHMGESAVIAPDGNLLFALPRDATGVAVFRVGDSQYKWMTENGRG